MNISNQNPNLAFKKNYVVKYPQKLNDWCDVEEATDFVMQFIIKNKYLKKDNIIEPYHIGDGNFVVCDKKTLAGQIINPIQNKFNLNRHNYESDSRNLPLNFLEQAMLAVKTDKKTKVLNYKA